jgi:diphthine synthase
MAAIAATTGGDGGGRLSLIGIGMGSAEDITLRGLNLAKSADVVFLEHYTAILIDDADTTKLEQLIGKPVVLADREAVEEATVLDAAESKGQHVALLVVGDPLSATTHCDLIERCSQKGIKKVDVVGNASIITAVGCTGLQLYRYGQALSLCFWTETWRPAGYYDRLAANRALGIHTLLLLDIKVKEISNENLARGRKIYEPPRYMSAPTAARQLLEIERERGLGIARPETVVITVARLGSPTGVTIVSTLQDLAAAPDEMIGAPLHSLVLPGDVHECEAEYVLLHPQLRSVVADNAASSSDQQQKPKLVLIDPRTPADQLPAGVTKIDRQHLVGPKTRVGPAERKAVLVALAEGQICA